MLLLSIVDLKCENESLRERSIKLCIVLLLSNSFNNLYFICINELLI